MTSATMDDFQKATEVCPQTKAFPLGYILASQGNLQLATFEQV
jgi:hypothetical protein